MASDSFFALWPIEPFGAEENNENNQQQQNSGEQQNNTGGSNSGTQQQNSQQNQQQQNNDDDDDPYAGLSAKELKRLLRDTEQSKDSTAKQLKDIQDAQDAEKRKKNDDLTNAQADLDAERETNKTLRASMNRLAIKDAIRDDKRYEWKNLDILAQQLNPEIVKVSDDGKVEGLTKELARIAKDSNLEFLLAKDNTKENQNNNQQQQQNNQQQQNGGNGNGSTGFQPGQGGANGGGHLPPNIDQLVQNTPALRSRM